MNTTAILNLVYTAKAHGASDDALAIATPQYLKKLRRRVQNVFQHHRATPAMLLSQPWDRDIMSADEWEDELNHHLSDGREQVIYVINDIEAVFGGEFNYAHLMEMSRRNPLEDWDCGLRHPAWKRFVLKLREELTEKLIELVNEHSPFAQA